MGFQVMANWQCDWCDQRGKSSGTDPRICLIPPGWWLRSDGQLFCPDCTDHKDQPPPLSAAAATFYAALQQAEDEQKYVSGSSSDLTRRLVRELSRHGITVGVVFGEHGQGAAVIGHCLGGNMTIPRPRASRVSDDPGAFKAPS
jgi:hypothetical protein